MEFTYIFAFCEKKYAIIAVLSIILFSGILHVKRGDIVRVFVFLMIYYSFIKIYLHQLNLQFISKIILAVIILITVFTVFGEYRLEARGAGSGIILEYLGSKVDSVAFAWLYGYMTFNFEIIKLYFEMTPLYEFNTFKELVAPTGEDKYIGVGTSGFNAATFLRYYIIAFGIFYFVGLFFYALIVGLLVVIAKKIRFIGLEIFIFTLLFLNLFGDYLILRSVFMSIIFSLLLFPFLKLEKNKFLQGIK